MLKKTIGRAIVAPLMDVEALTSFLEREFPQVNADGMTFIVTDAGEGFASMRLDPKDRHLRPGGTVSGPTLFALADLTAYVAILAQIGPVALAATINLSINFLRKPELGAIDATARVLKLGKRLAVVDISMISAVSGELVAHATSTYSIPPK
ncbi:PaaI family thioesterase [Phyllobacterium sp. BT25]|uniref:PaaI family thioesterase n=1 Tax=Phyllobacterium pellucidum TaxID=2740464 RepID=A0A849VKR7_9HYPH|nr:PaaI family thioesterase [Phyllobacterium pellucidum]NTS29886.1 PaaI family thioesterase [Phyllobacterium pellucidum]